MLTLDEQIEQIALDSQAKRIYLGKTLTDISRESGVCIASIHNLENGKRSCTLDTVLKILNAEGLTLKISPFTHGGLRTNVCIEDEWNQMDSVGLHKMIKQAAIGWDKGGK